MRNTNVLYFLIGLKNQNAERRLLAKIAGSSRQLSNIFPVGGEVKFWFYFLLRERKY